jgi:hypothetical protein
MVAAITTLALAGCATTQVSPEAKQRTYDVTSQEAFDAVRMYYADMGAQVQAGGREDGYLNATVQAEQIRPMLSGYQVVYNTQFFETDAGVRIQVEIQLEDEVNGVMTPWGEEGYEEFFSEVESRL